MKKILLSIIGLTAIFPAFGQYEMSSFTSTGRGGATTFATDYQTLGINPANLGWTWEFEEKKVAVGLTEMAYSLHSEALAKPEVRDIIRQSISGNFNEFTYDEKMQAAESFANSPFAFNMDLGSFGIAVTTEKLGGFGFAINDRIQWYSKFNDQVSQILFRGYSAPYFDSLMIVNSMGDTSFINNHEGLSEDTLAMIERGFSTAQSMFSDIIDGSQVSLSWTREYNLSYGRKIFEVDSLIAFYGGVGVKFIQGLGLMDIRTDENGELLAYSAMSPLFDIDYGSASLTNPSADTVNNGFLPDPVGKGWGFDLGFNVVIKNKLKIGVAMNNIGSVTWNGNVYSAKDTILYDMESPGLNSYNFIAQVNDFIGEDGMFKWDGANEKVVPLPTNVRMGASLRINEMIEVGADMIMSTNQVPGSYENAIIGFGGDIRPLPWLELSTGFVTGGNYGFNIPVGLLIRSPMGGYEMGVASRDAISFFVNNGPTLSIATGFMRFRF